MKKVDTSFISTTAGMPGKAGVLNHLQEAYQEVALAFAKNMIGPEYDATKVYVLYGCVNTGSGLTYIISAGAVFFNGEIYFVDAASFVASGAQVAIANSANTFATSAIGDPIQFTDGNSHNVLQIRKIALVAGTAGAGTHPDFSAWLRVNQVKTESKVNATYGSGVTINFRQDQSLFFTTGLTSGTGTINFDFNGAIPGTVVRMNLQCATGTTSVVSTPAGSAIVNEGGTITANKRNYIYFMYAGKNSDGNDEVSYNVISL